MAADTTGTRAGISASDGDHDSVGDRLASFEERQRSVAKDIWDAREARYRV